MAAIKRPVTFPMADNPLIKRPRPGALRITINDPERRYPLSSDLFGKIEPTFRDLDGDVRIVVRKPIARRR